MIIIETFLELTQKLHSTKSLKQNGKLLKLELSAHQLIKIVFLLLEEVLWQVQDRQILVCNGLQNQIELLQQLIKELEILMINQLRCSDKFQRKEALEAYLECNEYLKLWMITTVVHQIFKSFGKLCATSDYQFLKKNVVHFLTDLILTEMVKFHMTN